MFSNDSTYLRWLNPGGLPPSGYHLISRWFKPQIQRSNAIQALCYLVLPESFLDKYVPVEVFAEQT